MEITSGKIGNFYFIVILVIVGLIIKGCEKIKSVDKPNFIIFYDDKGCNDLGCFGSMENCTPKIYMMAKEGICFTNLYVTRSVCGPSRSSLKNGKKSLRSWRRAELSSCGAG